MPVSRPTMPFPEQALSPRDFAFLSRLVYDRSRICLGPEHRPLVASRLAGHLRSLGCAGFSDYCAILDAPTGTDEIEFLIDMVTTNHTHFFRERAHFELLAGHLLPTLGPRAATAGRPLRIWSAAAASGEEPYSLAIVMAEFARRHPLPAWRVFASDISRRMVERCRLGIYEAGKVALPTADLLPRYFRRGFGPREGYYRVRPEIRRAVTVEAVNLFQDPYPVPEALDVVFCRNVMIYFDAPSRAQLVGRLFEQLAPGGYLVIGHTESLLDLRHPFSQLSPSVYTRPL
jgi:chemotaxis protein methyltransferase CheR